MELKKFSRNLKKSKNSKEKGNNKYKKRKEMAFIQKIINKYFQPEILSWMNLIKK